jgi:hypothetical protein
MQNYVKTATIEDFLKVLQRDEKFKKEWLEISNIKNPFDKFKDYKQLLIEYIPNLRTQTKSYYADNLYEKNKLNAQYGNFIFNDNYYDLRVGKSHFLGAIPKKSLYQFGKSTNHYFICANVNFSKVAVYNANKLLQLVNESDFRIDKKTGQKYLGEVDYTKVYER